MGIMLSSGVRFVGVGGGGGGWVPHYEHFCIEWIGREGSLSNAVGLFCILCYQVEYIYIYFPFSFLIPY